MVNFINFFNNGRKQAMLQIIDYLQLEMNLTPLVFQAYALSVQLLFQS